MFFWNAIAPIKSYLPIVNWLPRYQRSWLWADILAGLTTWAVMVPEALAYANIAGVPAIYGLYTVPFPLFIYAILGTSRTLVVGPDSATALISSVTVGALVMSGTPDYFITTALLTGISGSVFFGFGFLKMGWIADFIPLPVMKGFIQGLVWVTIIGQIPNLLGIAGSKGNAFPKLFAIFEQLTQLHPLTTLLGLGSLWVVFVLKDRFPRSPSALLTMVLSIAVVIGFGLENHHVELIGKIATGLPRLALPPLDFAKILDLLSGALAIAMVGYAESLGAAQAAGDQTENVIDPNQELISYGLANWGAALTSGFVVVGSLSKTSVAIAAGAKSQVSSLVHGSLILLTLLFLTPLFYSLSHATLAAIVIEAMLGLSNWQALWRLRRIDSLAFTLAMTSFWGVLTLGVLRGIGLGVILSLILLIQRATHPETAILGKLLDNEMYRDIKRHPEAITIPGLLIFRFGGSLIFFSANYFREQLLLAIGQAAPQSVQEVLIDGESINLIDVTAIERLKTVKKQLDRQGIRLSFARVRDPVYNLMQRDGFVREVGEDYFYERISDGVAAFKTRSPTLFFF